MLPVERPVFPDPLRMGQPPLAGAFASLLPPIGIGVNVPEVGGIFLVPSVDIAPLPFSLTFRLGTDPLGGSIFAWRKRL